MSRDVRYMTDLEDAIRREKRLNPGKYAFWWLSLVIGLVFIIVGVTLFVMGVSGWGAEYYVLGWGFAIVGCWGISDAYRERKLYDALSRLPIQW